MKSFKTILFLTMAAVIFAVAAPALADAADMGMFYVEDGRVYKGREALGCEVYEVSSEIEGPLRYWAALGPDTSDIVAENETGVWFFDGTGAADRFIPLEDAGAGRVNVTFSPDEKYFLLDVGGLYRPDVTYVLYSRAGEKKEEFKEVEGIIGAKWVEPFRFVMSRIDGVRESEDGVYSTGLLRCSVVMYDTEASETTVLKEATDTKNYWFDSVTDDGGSLVIREVSVKSEKDWGNEEKTETREIEVEIPAVG